ncbi:MAG TPA: MFS transporter [Verrucomicrobiae bacterium]|nr:MFS transporter [Verrucomicrobiae bacterium]
MITSEPSAPRAARNYPLLLASQFLSAFGDNFILMAILGPLMTRLREGSITAEAQSVANIYFTSLIFIPYVLLAPLSGYLNDRYAKTHWLMGGNLIKLIGAALAAVSITSGQGWTAWGYFVVGIGACVYSPAKYGILPEILPNDRLVTANGMVEALTLVAILGGTVAGALAFDRFPLGVCYLIVVATYALSLVLNFAMTRTPSYPEVRLRHSVSEFFINLRELFSQKRLARILFGTALFWICGAMIKMNSQPWGQQVLQLKSMGAIGLLSVWLAAGVMAGSILAGRLYRVGDVHHTRRYGWLLAAGLGVLGGVGFLLHHGVDYPKTLSITVLIYTGLCAGLFLIPLNAALQAESHKDKLGKTIATQNGFENLAMLGGSGIAWLDVRIGFNPSQMFLALALFVAIVVIWLKIPAKSES